MDGSLTSRLLEWYDANRRELPWRLAVSPYGTWVSEIMAQQTQIDRVIGYWERWMERFPDVQSLAVAHEEDVLKLWEGLGYYSRARNIHTAARSIMEECGGCFPSDVSSIRSLPGIGEYTAGAIASIAFGLPEPAVDANVLRVFSRLCDIAAPVNKSAVKSEITDVVSDLIPEDRPGDFNQALMEFGALICSKRPKCDHCPLVDLCKAHAEGIVSERPVLPPSKKIIRVDMATGVLVHKGRVLIQKRKPDDVWPGLWEFPGGVIEKGETPEQALVREFDEEVELSIVPREKITVVSYAYTRYRITMHCFLCRMENGDVPRPVFNEAVEGGFMVPDELTGYAYPAGHRRLLEHLQGDLRFSELFG